AVRPVFLKSPPRVEALVCLLQLALTAYQLLERLYRQGVPDDAPATEKRMTSESLLRQFRVYGLVCQQQPIGRVVYASRLTSRRPFPPQRWTRADPPLANASTSSRLAMVTSPGYVVSNAPCAQPSRSASSGERPASKP